MALAPGDTFGRYTVIGTLGMGGMGQVLRAVDSVLERTVALKVIRADSIDREEAVARFFREARLAAQLTHPNTVQIYDLGEVAGVPFIAMEFIDGKPLTQLCGDVSVEPMRKLRWMLGAARGLAAAHNRGMVHRDVKPANIMVVQAEDVVKVVDFGLAKRTKTTDAQRATFNTALGFVVGTPMFMAPEQLDGVEADARCDQFAWGLTAYALVVGENPRRLDPMMLDPLVPLDRRVRGVAAEASAIVMRALSLSPSERYASMDRLIEELDAALSTSVRRDVGASRESPPAPVTAIRREPAVAPARAPAAPGPVPFRLVAHPLAPGRVGERIAIGVPLFPSLPAPRESVVPADPEPQQWRFERRRDRCAGVPLRVAAFSGDGKRVLAFGDGGVVLHQSGAWRPFALPTWIEPSEVACAALLDDGGAIIAGERALAAHVAPDGTSEPWAPERARPDVCFRGLEATPEGWVTLVGSAGRDAGILAWARPGGLQLSTSPRPLTAVATLASGRGQLACGPNGELVHSWAGVIKGLSLGGGDLRRIASGGDGAIVVGSGARAIHVRALAAHEPLQADLESVETTAALTAVASTARGTLWAASSMGEILRRDRTRRWVRITNELDHQPYILALWASDDRVRAVANDGSLILGWRRG